MIMSDQNNAKILLCVSFLGSLECDEFWHVYSGEGCLTLGMLLLRKTRTQRNIKHVIKVAHWENQMLNHHWIFLLGFRILSILSIFMCWMLWPKSGFVNIVRDIKSSVVECSRLGTLASSSMPKRVFLHILLFESFLEDIIFQITPDNNGISSQVCRWRCILSTNPVHFQTFNGAFRAEWNAGRISTHSNCTARLVYNVP